MYSQIESAEAELYLHQDMHLHQIDLHQEEAVQLLRESILRLLHALKANRPPEETWVSVVDKVEQGMDSPMVLDWSNGRDGLMLIKQGLATILEVRAGLKVMNNEIAAETLASVKQGLGMLEQNDATEQIGRSIASMVSLCLHPKSEGTKFFHGSFESVLGLLYPGLLGNALEESNKLVGEVAVATEVPHIGFTDKAEGEVEAKPVLKLIVDSLVKDKLDSLITDSLDKLLDQVEVATDKLATDEEDSEEHTKLPKRSLTDKAEGEVEVKSDLKLIVDSLEEKANKLLDLRDMSYLFDPRSPFLDQVEVATGKLATDEEDSEEHTKLPKRSLTTLRDMILLMAGDTSFECLCILCVPMALIGLSSFLTRYRLRLKGDL
jgi:hypothetical protein